MKFFTLCCFSILLFLDSLILKSIFSFPCDCPWRSCFCLDYGNTTESQTSLWIVLNSNWSLASLWTVLNSAWSLSTLRTTVVSCGLSSPLISLGVSSSNSSSLLSLLLPSLSNGFSSLMLCCISLDSFLILFFFYMYFLSFLLLRYCNWSYLTIDHRVVTNCDRGFVSLNPYYFLLWLCIKLDHRQSFLTQHVCFLPSMTSFFLSLPSVVGFAQEHDPQVTEL